MKIAIGLAIFFGLGIGFGLVCLAIPIYEAVQF